MYIELNIDGPHSPENTRETAEAFAEAARVLSHATEKPNGLASPSDIYYVLGDLAGGAARLPQALQQMNQWIRDQADQGFAVENANYGTHGGDTEAAVTDTANHLQQATAAANALHHHLKAAKGALRGMEARQP